MGRYGKNITTDFIVDDRLKNDISQYQWFKTKLGYLRATFIPNKRIYMHRLVFMLSGFDVEGKEIDHINRDPKDNRLVNLRIATRNLQGYNRGEFKNNTSGHKGVCWHNNRWQASIKICGKLIYLGRFNKEEDAIKAYNEAKEKAIVEATP